MTYNSNLQATEMEGFPELFYFFSGNRQDRVTSYSQDLTFLGAEYTARPIKRSRFTYDSNFSPVSVNIEAPLTDLFARYVANTPIEPTRVKIYRSVDSDLTDFRTIFTGTLRNIIMSARMAKATFDSKAKHLRTKIPRMIYQSFCNHNLFDSGCRLLESAFVETISVTLFNGGKTLRSSTFATHADGYYTNGRVVTTEGDERWIIAHAGQDITLQLAFDSRVTSGTIVNVLPGCDGNVDTCINKFNNHENFFGCPFIPSQNPVIYTVK